MVTNNEVSVDEEKRLTEKGYKPGDPEWDALGIARYVTWPRTVCSIEGHDVNGKPLKGTYLGSDIPMSEGFQSNAIFFKLGFLDKTSVALGRQLVELFPVLWMKAGAHGPCPELADESAVMAILPENRFAILIDERHFAEFEVQLACHPEIDTLYFVTDSDAGYREMISKYQTKETFQLYKDYLDNFRINTRR
jgi:adenine-specific DNA-methyltransferase